ncbi:MAG: HNH endonuclease [Acidimicrobiales bacterium]
MRQHPHRPRPPAWLDVHHMKHWEDGGGTDAINLICLCQHHHRLHHRGQLGIEGDGDEPNGVVFTDARGRRLASCGKPAPPGEMRPPPSNERLDERAPAWLQAS